MASAPLSADAQKLITDVFTQRFTDNSDSKTTTAQNDTITPQSGSAVKLANGDSVTPTLFVLNVSDHSSTSSDSNSNNLFVPFISLPPQAVTVGGLLDRASWPVAQFRDRYGIWHGQFYRYQRQRYSDGHSDVRYIFPSECAAWRHHRNVDGAAAGRDCGGGGANQCGPRLRQQ